MIWIEPVTEPKKNLYFTSTNEQTEKKDDQKDNNTIFQQMLDVAMKKISTQPPIV